MTPEQEAELRYYRDLLGAVCLLYERSQALDSASEDQEETAWNEYIDAQEDVFDFVRTAEHANAMDAAGVTCNELHNSPVVLSA